MKIIPCDSGEFQIQLQQYLFVNEETGEEVICDVTNILEAGIPIDSNTGEDLELKGIIVEEGVNGR